MNSALLRLINCAMSLMISKQQKFLDALQIAIYEFVICSRRFAWYTKLVITSLLNRRIAYQFWSNCCSPFDSGNSQVTNGHKRPTQILSRPETGLAKKDCFDCKQIHCIKFVRFGRTVQAERVKKGRANSGQMLVVKTQIEILN